MKVNFNKIHFKDSLTFLQAGEDVTANCGVEVTDPQFVGFLDVKAMGLQELSGINHCKACLTAGEKIPQRHYLYAIQAGKKSSMQGTEDAA